MCSLFRMILAINSYYLPKLHLPFALSFLLWGRGLLFIYVPQIPLNFLSKWHIFPWNIKSQVPSLLFKQLLLAILTSSLLRHSCQKDRRANPGNLLRRWCLYPFLPGNKMSLTSHTAFPLIRFFLLSFLTGSEEFSVLEECKEWRSEDRQVQMLPAEWQKL